MKDKWNKLSNKSKKRVLLLTLFFLILIIVPSTYAFYKGFVDVSVTTVAGEMISDIEIDANENYVENNIPYFYVIVKNYRVNGNVTLLSATAFDYKIIIDNKEGSNGLFTYADNKGNKIDVPTASLVIPNGHLNEDKSSYKYKVYVRTEGTKRATVDYKVRLEADQVARR